MFPNLSLDQVIAELLLERAQKNLIKYQVAARQFEAKYGRSFDAFRQMILNTEPSFQGPERKHMNAAELLHGPQQESQRRAYFTRVEVLDQSASLVKARLHIAPGLFVQVYRNDSFDTTNLVLIHNTDL